MPYVNPARLSRCPAVRNNWAGSGVMVNGSVDNPKILLYIAVDSRSQSTQRVNQAVLEPAAAEYGPNQLPRTSGKRLFVLFGAGEEVKFPQTGIGTVLDCVIERHHAGT